MAVNEQIKKFIPTKEQFHEVEEKLKEGKDKFAEVVKKYPITSVAIASGLGIVLGKLFWGRRR